MPRIHTTWPLPTQQPREVSRRMRTAGPPALIATTCTPAPTATSIGRVHQDGIDTATRQARGIRLDPTRRLIHNYRTTRCLARWAATAAATEGANRRRAVKVKRFLVGIALIATTAATAGAAALVP